MANPYVINNNIISSIVNRLYIYWIISITCKNLQPAPSRLTFIFRLNFASLKIIKYK